MRAKPKRAVRVPLVPREGRSRCCDKACYPRCADTVHARLL